jgi:hypothetical protein
MNEPDQIDSHIMALQEQLSSVQVEMSGIKADLAANTAVTQEVADLFMSFKGAFKVFDWIGTGISWAGRVALGLLAIWGLVSVFLPGGRVPGGKG